MLQNKISDLTIEEFRALIRDTVRQTLAEMLADPDEGLVLKSEIEEAMRRSIKAVREGVATYDAGKVAEKLGLDW